MTNPSVAYLHHPAIWRHLPITLVLTDVSVCNGLHFPLIKTYQFLQLHNAAAVSLVQSALPLSLILVDKDLFYTLASPPPPIPYPPPVEPITLNCLVLSPILNPPSM